jgi:N4-gp56 family major capsid protein
LNEAAQRLGVSLKQTDDQLMRDMLAATASFINCVNGTDGDFPTEISRSDIDITIRALVGANAHTISENIEGADMFGTGPIRDAYFMYSSTDIIPDLERVTGFIPKAQYPSPMHALQAEWGSVSNLRMLVTSVGSTTPQASTLGNTVYNNFCLGLEAYAAIEQDGYSAQFLYRPPIYDSPLALNASVGWKMANARVITQDTWVINLRSTISFPTN